MLSFSVLGRNRPETPGSDDDGVHGMLRIKNLLILTLLTTALLILPSKGWAQEDAKFLEVIKSVWPVFTAFVIVLAGGAFWVAKISAKVTAHDQKVGPGYTQEYVRLTMTVEQNQKEIANMKDDAKKSMADLIAENKVNLEKLGENLDKIGDRLSERIGELDKKIDTKTESLDEKIALLDIPRPA